MNQFMKVNKKIEKAVISGYKVIENSMVGSYKKIEDKFVEAFLTPDDADQGKATGISDQNDTKGCKEE